MAPLQNPEVIEPEIIDESGQVIPSAGSSREHARPQGDTSGVLGGLLVLAVGFLTTVAVLLFSVLVLVPLMLLGRLFGWQIRTWKR